MVVGAHPSLVVVRVGFRVLTSQTPKSSVPRIAPLYAGSRACHLQAAGNGTRPFSVARRASLSRSADDLPTSSCSTSIGTIGVLEQHESGRRCARAARRRSASLTPLPPSSGRPSGASSSPTAGRYQDLGAAQFRPRGVELARPGAREFGAVVQRHQGTPPDSLIRFISRALSASRARVSSGVSSRKFSASSSQ